MMELEKSDRGESEGIKMLELLSGRHSRGRSCTLSLGEEHYPCFVIRIWTFSKDTLYSLIPFAVVFIGSTLFALQQLSGINAVFYFSSTVFRSAGVPSSLANVFIGISNLAGSSLLLAGFRVYFEISLLIGQGH